MARALAACGQGRTRHDRDLRPGAVVPADAGYVVGITPPLPSPWQRPRVSAATMRRAGTAIFAVSFVVLGLPDFGHGVAWPDLRSEFERPLTDLGTFLTVAAAGYLAIATSTGRLAKRWGLERLVLRSTLSSAAGLLLIAIARRGRSSSSAVSCAARARAAWTPA